MELTKEYFDEQLKNLATKEELKSQTGTINGRFDGIEQRFLEFPTRQDYAALKSSVDDIQAKVTRIDQRTDEDTRAALKDIINLQKRVATLEQAVNLQPSH